MFFVVVAVVVCFVFCEENYKELLTSTFFRVAKCLKVSTRNVQPLKRTHRLNRLKYSLEVVFSLIFFPPTFSRHRPCLLLSSLTSCVNLAAFSTCELLFIFSFFPCQMDSAEGERERMSGWQTSVSSPHWVTCVQGVCWQKVTTVAHNANIKPKQYTHTHTHKLNIWASNEAFAAATH